MVLMTNSKHSSIQVSNGDFYIQMYGSAKKIIFLYKYKKISNVLEPEEIFNTDFDYDLVVLDSESGYYLYFTYSFISEPEEAL